MLSRSFATAGVVVAAVLVVVAAVLVVVAALVAPPPLERFAVEGYASSVLEPSWDVRKALDAYLAGEPPASPGGATKTAEFWEKLGAEQAKLLTCAFYDLMASSKRLDRPANRSPGEWLAQLWSEAKSWVGLPPLLFANVLTTVILPAASGNKKTYDDVYNALAAYQKLSVPLRNFLGPGFDPPEPFPKSSELYKSALTSATRAFDKVVEPLTTEETSPSPSPPPPPPHGRRRCGCRCCPR